MAFGVTGKTQKRRRLRECFSRSRETLALCKFAIAHQSEFALSFVSAILIVPKTKTSRNARRHAFHYVYPSGRRGLFRVSRTGEEIPFSAHTLENHVFSVVWIRLSFSCCRRSESERHQTSLCIFPSVFGVGVSEIELPSTKNKDRNAHWICLWKAILFIHMFWWREKHKLDIGLWELCCLLYM